ncbi:MAG: hypothetical protein QMD65_00215 [Patescibacteria group bacterium]|nr:hypothetical protein [Patescibacteria group bacterium]
MKSIIKFTAIVGIAIIMALPLITSARAAGPLTPPVTYVPPITSITEVKGLLDRLINWLQYIFFALTAFFLIGAAFLYLTAAGDEDKVKKAKQMIIYAVIAMVIALLATAVNTIVITLLQR